MKNIKYACRELWKNPLTFVLLMVQSIIIYVLVVCMISAVHSRFRIYDEIAGLVKENGVSVRFFGLNDPNGAAVMDADTAKKCLKGVKKVSGCYDVSFETVTKGRNVVIKTTAYDTDLWKCHTPAMEEGRWFQEKDEKTEQIEAVIAQKDGRNGTYHVGDVLTVSEDDQKMDRCEEHPIQVKIIGIIKDGAQILGTNDDNMDMTDVRRCFWNYSGEYHQLPYMFLTHKDIYNYKIKYAQGLPLLMSGLTFISWDRSENGKFAEKIDKYFAKNAEFTSYIKNGQLRKESVQYVLEQVKNMLPIILSLMFLAILTIVSCTSILVRQSLYKYGVFYLNGLTWKECMCLQRRAVLILETMAFVAAWAALKVLVMCGRLKEMMILFSMWEFAGCLFILWVFWLFGYVTIRQEIGKKSGKDVLTESGITE
mgnify:FL=1